DPDRLRAGLAVHVRDHPDHRHRALSFPAHHLARHVSHRNRSRGARSAVRRLHRPPPDRPARSRRGAQVEAVNHMKSLKLTLVLALVAAVAAAIVVARMPKPVPVETAAVEQGPLRVTIDEDGRTRVQDRYVIASPLAGNLARIELEPGAAVKEADVL